MTIDLSKRINQLYTALRKSQFEFAGEIGFTHGAISKIESGQTKQPSRGLIFAILQTYPQVNEAWLRTGEGPMFHEMAVPTEQVHGAMDDGAAIYAITRCAEDPECKRLCETYLQPPSPDARQMLSMMVNILRSGNEGAITSLKYNLVTYEKAVEDSERLTKLLRPKSRSTGRKAT